MRPKTKRRLVRLVVDPLIKLDLVGDKFHQFILDMGVSENSVPRKTQWLMIIIPIKWLFHWEYTLFSDKPILKKKTIHGLFNFKHFFFL